MKRVVTSVTKLSDQLRIYVIAKAIQVTQPEKRNTQEIKSFFHCLPLSATDRPLPTGSTSSIRISGAHWARPHLFSATGSQLIVLLIG